jgi:hypothetical protein
MARSAALAAALAPAAACAAQGFFGPPVLTVSPADAVAVMQACGGAGAGIDIALALQADRFAEWSSRREAASAIGGPDALWLRVVAARRDAGGAVLPADARGLRDAARAVLEDLASQRRADRRMLESVVEHACGGADRGAARARASAILRRPMLFESEGGIVTDRLQFLECDPGVVERLLALRAGDALQAAGAAVELALAERQREAVERWLDAALSNSAPDRTRSGTDVNEGAWRATGRAARTIGAFDPAAGAWIRLGAARDRAEHGGLPPLSDAALVRSIGAKPEVVGDEEGPVLDWERRRAEALANARSERERLVALADRQLAALEALVTQPPTTEILALGARLASEADGIASRLEAQDLCGGEALEGLAARVAAAVRDARTAVPQPRSYAASAKEVFRLASWQPEGWERPSVEEVDGCGSDPGILRDSGWPVQSALACVDVARVCGRAPEDRAASCRELATLAEERTGVDAQPASPGKAEAMADLRRRLRNQVALMLRRSAAALPGAGAPDEARARALRDWALSALPGLSRMRTDAECALREAGRPDADARIARMDAAVADAVERVLATLPDAAPADRVSDTRMAVLGVTPIRAAANAIQQAAASAARPAATDPGARSIEERLRGDGP